MRLIPVASAAVIVPRMSGDHPLAGEKAPRCRMSHRLCQDPEGGIQPGLCPHGDNCDVLKKER
ncbi:hypothetical protein A2215_00265 [Candidatus Berkelbacteria bacterium RIFOXYA2_FULL_43_10]|uniref:Uncharacterized protein n=1 Tax=Candidatus Berkelbacteria bacterium RIFOXYA2_FULL_43_10 TaxID=1797472 RepID=A0A1F5EDD9_9BACT|nr:MAG: hypothetical protein A2215_00265 [Candidatus Berkelbacteria bacterium RIFOXYA2_FULL_43_10]